MTGFPAHAQYSPDREPAGPSSRKTGLAITEIMYNPRAVPGQSTNVTLEFIEVFNSKPWAEDISGFSIDGLVRYVFPSNSVLAAGGYVVVARYPGLVFTNYGITNVVGPWIGATTNRLSTERGLIQLRNRQGAVLLAINYQDAPPWPEAADGTGHSLVLARPSYGEDDFRAWSQSDVVGGSPGRPDPQGPEPLADVVINEWQNHSDPLDWIELYNHSNIPVDLSGAWLSDDPTTNKYRIQNGTTIPARGFLTWDQNQLGFELFAGGETILLWNSNQTRVIDVIDFRGASNNVAQGRWPDGGPLVYGMSMNTRGAATTAVAWLKVLLPLAALGILSTLFLVSRTINPDDAIAFAEVDVADRIREPRVTAPTWAGMTEDGSALTVTAAEARPADAAGSDANASALRAVLDMPGGGRADLQAATGRLDLAANRLVVEGGVVITTSTGYTLRTAALEAALDRTGLIAPGAVEGDGPGGHLTAGSMELTATGDSPKRYVMVFKNRVRLLYQPAE